MEKCKGYNKYRGLRKPKCNAGAGCAVCNRKYEVAQDLMRALDRMEPGFSFDELAQAIDDMIGQRERTVARFAQGVTGA